MTNDPKPAPDAQVDLETLAALLRDRNDTDARIGDLLGRPMASGHAGEWIAARVFNIELEMSASTPAIDGRFRDGPLAGKTVNVKWYLKREGLLDMTPSSALDFYLVLTGPGVGLGDVKTLRPWLIKSAYLFDAPRVLEQLMKRNVKIGIASSVTRDQWAAAEIFPTASNRLLHLTEEQRRQLLLFS